jgi:beta-lactamase class A
MKEATRKVKYRYAWIALLTGALFSLNSQAAGAAASRSSETAVRTSQTQEKTEEVRTSEADDQTEKIRTSQAEDKIVESQTSETEEQTAETEEVNLFIILPYEAETETETEEETETETETETENESERRQQEADARNFRLRRILSSMPEGFLFPMVMTDTEQMPSLYELKDNRHLHGLRPVFLHGEKDLFGAMNSKELSMLQPILEQVLAGYDGDWSVYVKNLNTDESFIINDRPMKSASVMKLFIMGTVYRAFEDGDLERTEEVMALMNNMISVSDNESSNQLLYMLGRGSYQAGIDKVNAFIQEYGFSDMTMEYNGFENAATVMDSSHFNQVSAKDCGKLLEDVYRRVWVSRAASNEIEQMMLNQHTRYKIPRGLPDGVLCGNKTGEMDTTENDAAIIYSENCDYILVVLSSDWSSKDTAITRIATLSGIVYEFLN